MSKNSLPQPLRYYSILGKLLLLCSTVDIVQSEDDRSLDELEHVSPVKYIYIFKLYGKTVNNVCCLIREKCAADVEGFHILSMLVIVCTIHKFNFAVSVLLEDEEVMLSNVIQLMSKRKMLLLGAKLFKICYLHEETRNYTGWSSTFEIVFRFLAIKECLPK